MNKTEKLQQLLSGLTEQIGLVDFYLKEASKLPKRDTVFSVCDLDDTLFSRKEQLEQEPILREKRGYEGNTHMINHIGIHEMIEKHYEGKTYPQDILQNLSPENSLILTAGIPEYQELKIRGMHLTHFPRKIVWEGKDKVLETIRYIIFMLGYVPKEIIVYEDRPQFFIEYRELIEGILGCKLTIMYVEMDGNSGYTKIEEI